MNITRRKVLASGAFAIVGASTRARAQVAALRIGVLTDMSGILRDVAGPTAVACARQAIDEFDDQDRVDVIVEGSNSAVALAVSEVAREKDRIAVISGAGTSNLTGSQCNGNTIHWSYDTYMLAKSTGAAMVKAGGTTWFFITTDYAFGHAMARDTGDFVTAAGGMVIGEVTYPFTNSSDFSSQLLQAQGSGAKVIGLASAGPDTVDQIKQAREFGITQAGVKLAGLLMFISDVNEIGLEAAQGLVVTNSFYWNANDRTRAFSERLKPRAPTLRPTMVQAGVYASTLHYLKAAREMGFAEAKRSGAATVARMKAMPADDDAFGASTVRADGRVLHPSYLWEIKSVSESKEPWDYYKLLATTPAEEAFRPMLAACGRAP